MVFNWLACVRIVSVLRSGTKSNSRLRRYNPKLHRGETAIIQALEPRRVLSPVISGVEATTGTFLVGGPAEPITSTATLSDSGSSTITGATVSLGPTFRASEDVLSFDNTPQITGNFDSSTGTLTLSGNDSVAHYQDALRSVMYQDILANPTPNIRRFTIEASDATGTSASVNRYISPTSLISNVETGAQSVAGGATPTPISDTLTLGNTASGNITGARVKIDANYVIGEDVLAFTDTPNITGNFVAATGTLALSGTDTVAHYQDALRSITYANTSSIPTPGVRRLAITVNGATNPAYVVNRYFAPARASISNDLTVSSVETTAGTFSAGGPAVPVTSTATLSSANSSTLTGASVSLGPTFRAGEDVLSFVNTPRITGNFDASTGKLTLSGTDTVTHYQDALRSVMYQDILANPTPNIRRFSINISNGAQISSDVNRYINLTSLISNVETGAQNFVGGSAPTKISNTLTLDNTASGMVTGATVKVDANYVLGEDVLAFNNTPNITGVFNAVTGTLTLSGTDTVAKYQAALRSITYANTSNTPMMAVRRLAISVNGATNPSFVADRYFNVT